MKSFILFTTKNPRTHEIQKMAVPTYRVKEIYEITPNDQNYDRAFTTRIRMQTGETYDSITTIDDLIISSDDNIVKKIRKDN